MTLVYLGAFVANVAASLEHKVPNLNPRDFAQAQIERNSPVGLKRSAAELYGILNMSIMRTCIVIRHFIILSRPIDWKININYSPFVRF